MASCQETATTGILGSLKFGSPQFGGGATRVASRKHRYSAFVTCQAANSNESTHTRWAGFSSSLPISHPIENHCAGMRTIAGSMKHGCFPLAPPKLGDAAVMLLIFLPRNETILRYR